MAVELVGDGPAAEAVTAALADVGVDTRPAKPGTQETDLAVAVARSGEASLRTVNDDALGTDRRWIGVELGGVGGEPLVDASVVGFGPRTACYRCLVGRVQANLGADAPERGDPSKGTARYAGAIAGRVAAAYRSADDASVFGTVLEVPHAERPILPLPDCRCDDSSDSRLSLRSVDRPLDAALDRAERGRDDRVGLVSDVGEVESMPVPYYLARNGDTSGFSDATAATEAAGTAVGWDEAYMKALGEALERYAAGVYRLADGPQGPPGAVDGAVWPGAFVGASEPAGDEAIHWVAGRNLHDDAPVKLPAEFVHYPPATERFRPAITTGLGLGNGGCQAVLSGLTEVIERDAAMLSWYSTFEPLELAIDGEGFDDLLARARVPDLDVTTLLLTQDVDVPVVAAAVRRPDWPRLALGTAADLDAVAAARSALTEALQNWMELRRMGPDGAGDAGGAIGRFAAKPANLEGFASPTATVDASSLGPDPVPTGRDALGAVLERLDAAGLGAYAAPLTPRDVRKLGFEAVRALVPRAQPLFLDDPYFGERAATVPASLGFEPRLDRTHHPFP